MANGVKEYSDLKKRAMLAKQRLRMGYWKEMSEEKARALSEIGLNYEAIQRVKDIQHAKFERDVSRNLGVGMVAEDDILYGRVVEMMESGEEIINPIGRLIDTEAYEAMDEAAKQRYILKLSKKYREMVERYRLEKLSETALKLSGS